ncbi:unnamed protein product [Calypogeia fissa]
MAHLKELLKTATMHLIISFIVFLTTVFRLFTIAIAPPEGINEDTFVDCDREDEDISEGVTVEETPVPTFADVFATSSVKVATSSSSGESSKVAESLEEEIAKMIPSEASSSAEAPAETAPSEVTSPAEAPHVYRFVAPRIDQDTLQEHSTEPPRKFYSVVRGCNPGIYTSWKEAKPQVHGFSGQDHKSFSTYGQAEAHYLTGMRARRA